MQGKSARVVAGLLVMLAAAGCAGKSAVDTGPGDDKNVQGGTGNLIDLSGHDYHARDVSGTSLTGQRVSLADLPGRLKVVNFWGSWCAPCVSEEPGLAELAKQYAAKGVSFLGIDERDNTASAVAFEHKYGVTYPSIFDRYATLLLAFPGAVPATTPTTIIVGTGGKLLAKIPGEVEYTYLRDQIDHYLASETA
jgi:thiol-disulfide isomerase/thioredoxin